MDDIERLCSRVLILKEGELLYDGKPEGLTGKGERQLRVRFLHAPTVETLCEVTGLAATQIRQAEASGGDEEGEALPFLLSLQKDAIVPTLQKLLAKFELVDMGIQEPNLESVIQRIYEGECAT